MKDIFPRIIYFFGGLFGAAGIAAFAAAAHIGGYYQSIAPILLGNAAILCLLARENKTQLKVSAALIIIGILLFSIDLLLRNFGFERLFAYAAPTGGLLSIAGWLNMALYGLFSRHMRAK